MSCRGARPSACNQTPTKLDTCALAPVIVRCPPQPPDRRQSYAGLEGELAHGPLTEGSRKRSASRPVVFGRHSKAKVLRAGRSGNRCTANRCSTTSGGAVADGFYGQGLRLPSGSNMNQSTQDRVIEIVPSVSDDI